MPMAPAIVAPPALTGTPVVVLDTNALLDWHVFRDPAMRPVAAAIGNGRLRWLACATMQREWSLVWPRTSFARWQPDADMAQAAFACAYLLPEPPRGPLRCKDPDDQVFIDLALHTGARWLLTKDGALLRLAKRARAHGLDVVPPSDWPPEA